jgi:ABC-type transporter Mla subunit MlaD
VKATRAQNVRLGVFLLGSAVLFLGGLMALAGLTLFHRRAAYELYFDQSISGLDAGAPVRVLGVQRGTVKRIELEAQSTRAHVTIEIAADTPLHADASATLGFLGLTGLRYIEIDPGQKAQPILPPGATLPTQSGLGAIGSDLQNLTRQASELLARLNQFLVPANQERLLALVDSLHETLDALRQVVEHNRDEVGVLAHNVNATLASYQRLADEAVPVVRQAGALLARMDRTVAQVPVGRMSARLDAILASLEQTLGGPEFRQSVTHLAQVAQHADAGLTQTLDQAATLLASLQRASRQLELLLEDVRRQPSMLLRGRRPETP